MQTIERLELVVCQLANFSIGFDTSQIRHIQTLTPDMDNHKSVSIENLLSFSDLTITPKKQLTLADSLNLPNVLIPEPLNIVEIKTQNLHPLPKIIKERTQLNGFVAIHLIENQPPIFIFDLSLIVMVN